MQNLIAQYQKFEIWFNQNLGWFFTNGNKVNQYENFHDNKK